jgi:hypothetical protein
VADALACPRAACTGAVLATVGELGAHLIEIHGAKASVALEEARRTAAKADPFGLDRNGIKTHEEVPAHAGDPDRLPLLILHPWTRLWSRFTVRVADLSAALLLARALRARIERHALN